MIALFNQEQKNLANEIINSVKNGQFSIRTKTKLSNNEIMAVFKICMGDIPEYINFDNCRLSFQAGFDSKVIKLLPQKRSQTDYFKDTDISFLMKKAEEIVCNLRLKEKNDMMKAVGIYDYLCRSVKYAITQNSQNAWGALVDKTAVCEGIACAFNLLAKTSGLRSTVIHGTMNNGPHAWNIIQINNCFYHVDATSALEDKEADANSNYDFIFLQDSDMKGYIWNKTFYPECASAQHNYFVCSHSFAKSRKEAEEIIKRQVSSKCIVYLRAASNLNFTEEEAYNIFIKVLKEQGVSLTSGSIRTNAKLDIIQIKYSI